MPKTTTKTAPAPGLIDRITEQLPEHRGHVVATDTLARWQREAHALRARTISESVAERAAAGGPLPLDLIRETIASEQDAAELNRLNVQLHQLRTLQQLYHLSADEHERAAEILQDELDVLMRRVDALDEHDAPASADEALQSGPEATELWKSLLQAVEDYDEIRRAQEHFTRLHLTSDRSHGWRTRFHRVGLFREQLDLDAAWLNRRREAGAAQFNTTDTATLEYNEWLRPTAEQTRDAWHIVGGDTVWPCTDRVAYLLWLARHTTPFVPTLDTIDAAHKHAEWATLDLHPDRVEAAEHHRDEYWRTVGTKPVVPYKRHTSAVVGGTLSTSGTPARP